MNGTDAKDVVCHWLAKTGQRATPSTMSRSITNAKTLFASGYTKEEIIQVIDYSVDVKKIDVFSFGFYLNTIDTMMRDVRKHQALQGMKDSMKEAAPLSEVNAVDDKSAERNRNKASRFGTKSRFREEFNFDLHEE